MPDQEPRLEQPVSHLKFGDFYRFHPTYDRDEQAKLKLLFEGGWKIREHARKFVPRAPEEPDSFYEYRCQATAYENVFAEIIGQWMGQLFRVPLSVRPEKDNPEDAVSPDPPDPQFYRLFATDCDRKGTDFSQFIRKRTQEAVVYRRSFFGVDFPRLEGEAPAHRAEEDALGAARAYLFEIPEGEVINWETNEITGEFKWVVLFRRMQERDDPTKLGRGHYFEFKIWTMVEGVAAWMRFVTERFPEPGRFPEPQYPLLEAGSGITSFKRIPIVMLEVPIALWAGDLIGPLQESHYRQNCDLTGAMARSLVEIPVIRRGPEIGGFKDMIPSESQQNPNRAADPVGIYQAKGYVAIGSGDELMFAGPSGRAFDIAERRIDKTAEAMHRVSGTMSLMVQNSAAAVGRSGDSKAQDKTATDVVLEALANVVREHAIKVMTIISEGRQDVVQWAANGIDSFEQEDAATLIEEETLLQTVKPPSRTWSELRKLRLARATVKATDEQILAIQKEIREGVQEQEEREKLLGLPPEQDFGGKPKPKPTAQPQPS